MREDILTLGTNTHLYMIKVGSTDVINATEAITEIVNL